MAYSKGIDMETRALILVLWTMCSLCATQKVDYGPECEYKGDMGDISVENCIAKMEADGDLDNCPGVIYGPGTLFRQRGETPFWIDIKNPSRGKYPENLTYKILNKPDIDQPENLTQIPGCDSMKLNEPGECVLQPIKEKELNWIYLPLLNDPDFSYCSYYIDEFKSGAIEFCDGDDYEDPCYEMEDGRYRRINPFYPVSTSENFPDPTEFCFFSLPEDYIVARHNKTEIFKHPNITSQGKGRNVTALLGEKTLNCTIKETHNSQEEHPAKLAPDYLERNSDYVCYFFRAVSQNIGWTTHARCLRIEIEENIPLEVVLGVSFALFFVLIIAVAAGCLYKRYYPTSKKSKAEIQESLGINFNYRSDFDDESSLPTQEKEIPRKIVLGSETIEQCTDNVDHSFENSFEQIPNGIQETLNSHSIAQEDNEIGQVRENSFDSGYVSKDKNPFSYVKTLTNQQDIPEVVVNIDYVHK